MTTRPVALFAPTLAGGGAERVTVNLARGFAARGLPVDLVLARATGPNLRLVPPSVRVVDLGARRVLTALPGLARYLRRTRPIGLITSSLHGSIAALWARRLARVSTPTFVTVHNSRTAADHGRRPPRVRALALLARWTYPHADGVVAVSRGVAQDVAAATHLPIERIHVIYNPVIMPELAERARQPAEHPWLDAGAPAVILAVGRLTWEKDYATLLRAFALIRARRAARLLILGDGPERQTLEALVRDLRLVDDVSMPGFVANPYACMARCAVFVLSSVTEGLPTVLIEALAAGSPVVSTDCPSGPREILEAGRYGALVPVGDPPALAAAIVAALDRPRAPAPHEAWCPYTLDAALDRYLGLLGIDHRA